MHCPQHQIDHNTTCSQCNALGKSLQQPVVKKVGLDLFESKLRLNAESLYQKIIATPHKTLADFAASLQINPQEIADYLKQKGLPPFWKIRFHSLPVGKFFLRLRPEFNENPFVSLLRIAEELGTDEAELDAECQQIFSFYFEELVYLITKIAPEKFYMLVKEYNMLLNELTNKQLFLLKTQLTLACHSHKPIFESKPEFEQLLLLNPHIVLLGKQHLTQ